MWPFSKKLIYKRAGISDFSGQFDVLEIKVPKNLEVRNGELRTAPVAAEHMFATIHGLLRDDNFSQEHFALEFVATDSSIKFYVIAPNSIAKSLESQIYGQYPTAHISKVSDYVPTEFKHGFYKTATMHLSKPDYFPLKSFKDFEIDPLSSITSALSEAKAGEDIWVQLIVKPVPDIWQKDGYKYIESLRSGNPLIMPSMGSSVSALVGKELQELTRTFFDSLAGKYDVQNGYISKPKSDVVKLSFSQEQEIKSIENKLSKIGFSLLIRFISHSDREDRAEILLRSAIASMQQFSTSNLNSFIAKIKGQDDFLFQDFKNRVFDEEKSFILNIEELGAIYHLPTALVETPGMEWVGSKKAEPPINVPTEDCTFIGYTSFRDRKIKFGISNKGDDRVRHMYLIGKSGTGKSTYFKNMIVQDIANGFGVGVLDPHGDLIEDVLEYIPDHRIKDVVLVDPSDTERPVGINLLELDDTSQKNLMASALISSIKSQFSSWGPRLEYLLNYCVLTLLDVPGTSILGITRLMADQNYQNYILHFVKDPVVSDFWNKEFKAMKGNQRLITEAVAPIENKINRFLSSTTIRNIVGQKKSTIDIWDIMNSGKILLLNLSKGKIGQDNANLLGSLLVSRIQFMAMQRVKIPNREDRRPFYLYVDEFQNFAGGEFESILSESRKYNLGLYLTHQYTSQLPEELLSAVFGNVGTIASFGVGAPDAKLLETEFAPYFDQNDLISLQKFQVYIKLMIDGQTSKPFSAEIFRPWLPEDAIISKTKNKALAVEQSRQTYGVQREHVEEKIRKWVEFPFDKGKAVAREYNIKDKEAQGQNAEVGNAEVVVDTDLASTDKPANLWEIKPNPADDIYYDEENKRSNERI